MTSINIKLNSDDIAKSLRHLEKTFLEGKPSNNLQMIDINSIILRDKSLRKHSKKQLQKLKNAIKKVGYTNPIIIDENQNIIAGELRLLAAERCKRRARLIEINPRYVDVTIYRWEKETGKTAKLIKNFVEVQDGE